MRRITIRIVCFMFKCLSQYFTGSTIYTQKYFYPLTLILRNIITGVNDFEDFFLNVGFTSMWLEKEEKQRGNKMPDRQNGSKASI